jgi:hypothetical protein
MKKTLSRIIVYCVGFLIILAIVDKYFADTYSANLGLFFIFSSTYELASFNGCFGYRKMSYFLVLTAAAVAAIFLLSEGLAVQRLK